MPEFIIVVIQHRKRMTLYCATQKVTAYNDFKQMKIKKCCQDNLGALMVLNAIDLTILNDSSDEKQ